MERDGWTPTDVVADLCRSALAHTEPVGLTHAYACRHHRGKHAGLLHASDEQARRLAELHETLGEGPAVLAAEEGRPVFIADLETDPLNRLWVLFRAEATALGVRAVYAFPLQIGAINIGMFVLHGSQPVTMDHDVMAAVLRIRSSLALTLLAPDPRQGWGDPMTSSHTITHQAAGMVMAQLDSTIDEALLHVRAHALGTGLSVAEVAAQVVGRTLRFSISDSRQIVHDNYHDETGAGHE